MYIVKIVHSYIDIYIFIMTAKRRETNVLRIMHLLSITGFGKVGNIFILVLIFTLEYIKEMINIDADRVYIYRVLNIIFHKKL